MSFDFISILYRLVYHTSTVPWLFIQSCRLSSYEYKISISFVFSFTLPVPPVCQPRTSGGVVSTAAALEQRCLLPGRPLPGSTAQALGLSRLLPSPTRGFISTSDPSEEGPDRRALPRRSLVSPRLVSSIGASCVAGQRVRRWWGRGTFRVIRTSRHPRRTWCASDPPRWMTCGRCSTAT